MSTNTKIEWADKTWNPVTGCDKVSAGCRNCYAERIANRFRGTPAFPNGFDVTLKHDRLGDPLKWRKPQRVFVNSMSDLFHESVPFKFIHEVWGVMRQTPQHTYQILTKRADRMRAVVSQIRSMEAMGYANGFYSHVALGVSVENQAAADLRIPDLLETPASIRFISAEPLLGPVDLNHLPITDPARPNSSLHYSALHETHDDCFYSAPSKLDWVIVGGESGAGARPMNPAWARSLRDQCQAAGVPFFFKQWGAFRHNGEPADWNKQTFHRVGKKAAGRLLDGREWNEYPKAEK